MVTWFGKGCQYLIAEWEENEATGGENYQEHPPILKFCNHPKNPDDCEGNCNKSVCPLDFNNATTTS